MSWIATSAIAGLLLLPATWRLYTFRPTASANGDYSFSLVHLLYALWTFLTGYSLGPSAAELHLPSRLAVTVRYAPLIVPVLGSVGVLCLAGARQLHRRDQNSFFILIAWFLCPILFALAGSLVTVHPFNVRYVILAFPPLVAAIALGVDSLGHRWLRWTASAGVVLMSCASLFGYFHIDRYAREDNRGAGRFLTEHAVAGDLVVASAPYTVETLLYYVRGVVPIVVGYPTREKQVDSSKVAVELATLVGQRQRFWLFLSRTYSSDPNDRLANYCDHHFRTLLTFTGNGVRLALYQRLPLEDSEPALDDQ